MFRYSPENAKILRVIVLLLVCSFSVSFPGYIRASVDPFPSILAVWTAMERTPLLERAEAMRLYLELGDRLEFAGDRGAGSELFEENNNAEAILLARGNIIAREAVKSSPESFLRTVIHADIAALMQVMAAFYPQNYEKIREEVLSDEKITGTYKKLFPGNGKLARDTRFNDITARAFVFIVLKERKLLSRPGLTSEERDFIDAVEPVIKRNRRELFTTAFWNSDIRGYYIKIFLVSSDFEPVPVVPVVVYGADPGEAGKPFKKDVETLLRELDNADPYARLDIKKEMTAMGKEAVSGLVFAVGHPPLHASDCASSVLLEIARDFPEEVRSEIVSRSEKFPENLRLRDLLREMEKTAAASGAGPDMLPRLNIRRVRYLAEKSNAGPALVRAAEYFNEYVVSPLSGGGGTLEPLTWKKIVDIFEIMRSDRGRREYEDGSIRAARLESEKYYPLGEILAEMNKIYGSDDELIHKASWLFARIVREQVLAGLPGFDIMREWHGNSTRGMDHPANGHNRLAWFILNYMLINNGRTPFYFEGNEYGNAGFFGYFQLQNKSLLETRRRELEELIRERTRRTEVTPVADSESPVAGTVSLIHTGVSAVYPEDADAGPAKEDIEAMFSSSISDLRHFVDVGPMEISGEYSPVTSGNIITGSSIIIYADDVLEKAAVVDLENAVRGVRDMLEGGRVVIYAVKERNAEILEKIIEGAAPGLEILAITRSGLESQKYASATEAGETEKLISLAQVKGVSHGSILAIVRGRLKDPGSLARILAENNLPLVSLSGEKGIYLLLPALDKAIEKKGFFERKGKVAGGWFIILAPERPLSEEFETEYNDYLKLLAIQQSA